MMDYLVVVSPLSAAVAVVAVILAVVLYNRKDRDSLLGPTGVPFLGFYPFMRDEYHFQMVQLAKSYGDVFSFTVTGQPYVLINSLKVLREAFVSKADCFGARGRSYSILKYCYNKGLGYEEGESWKTLRKFYIQNLKEFGMSSLKKGNMGAPVDIALQNVTEEFRNFKGEPFDAVAILTKHCTSIAQQLLFRGVDIDTKDLDDLNKAYWDMLSAMRGTLLLLSGPIAKYFVLPFVSGYREMLAGKKTMDSILMKIIRDHESTLNEDNPRDLVDCYIIERNLRTKKEDPSALYFTNEGLASSLIQFLGDSSLTNGYFVAVLLKALVDKQEVQQRMRAELLEVVGSDRLPSLEDKTNLPYCNAVITEILRTFDFAPIFPSLMCTKETTLGGYKVPAGHITVVNFYAILHNPEVYKDPDSFDPNRFIATPDRPKEESPPAFGIGRRACAGEALCMAEAFLFLATLVRDFRFVPLLGQDATRKQSPQVDDIAIRICALSVSEE